MKFEIGYSYIIIGLIAMVLLFLMPLILNDIGIIVSWSLVGITISIALYDIIKTRQDYSKKG